MVKAVIFVEIVVIFVDFNTWELLLLQKPKCALKKRFLKVIAKKQ